MKVEVEGSSYDEKVTIKITISVLEATVHKISLGELIGMVRMLKGGRASGLLRYFAEWAEKEEEEVKKGAKDND